MRSSSPQKKDVWILQTVWSTPLNYLVIWTRLLRVWSAYVFRTVCNDTYSLSHRSGPLTWPLSVLPDYFYSGTIIVLRSAPVQIIELWLSSLLEEMMHHFLQRLPDQPVLRINGSAIDIRRDHCLSFIADWFAWWSFCRWKVIQRKSLCCSLWRTMV